jgi:hypothetical protein
VEDVVAAAELPGALHGQQVGDALHHADDPRVAPGVAADGAGVALGEGLAGGAAADVADHPDHRLGQGPGLLGAGLEDVEGEPLRRLLPDAGQAGQLADQPRDGIGDRQAATP